MSQRQGGFANKARPPPPPPSTGTRVVLPPLPAAGSAATAPSVKSSTGPNNNIVSSSSNSNATNPSRLLDDFDAYVAGRRRSSTTTPTSGSHANKKDNHNQIAAAKPNAIAFLNQHYTSEAMLVTQLPVLRDAISERMDNLDDKLATAVQRQSESAPATRRHVQEARDSVISLEERIRQVRDKASQSERTVREITKDMKRLDCAKRHLQSTITALKRLHMLIHAVEGLRLACLQTPHPDYPTAAQLVDATRLLLHHFEAAAYTQKVEPMRKLTQKVHDLQSELKYHLVRGFRVVAFGVEMTKELERKKGGDYKTKSAALSTTAEGDEQSTDTGSMSDQASSTASSSPPLDVVPLTPDAMMGGIRLVDAIGKEARIEFMTGFIQDHLVEYSRIYKPVREQPEQPKEKPRVSSFMAQPEPPLSTKLPQDTKPEFALEFVEKRFLWFRNLLTGLQSTFPGVFPQYWNMEYHLTKNFLRRTRSHLLGLLKGPTKDPDANDATVLLKALQKTIVFEKEVSNGLQSQFGVMFVDPKNEENKDEEKPTAENQNNDNDGGASTEQVPVDPLFGVASSAFDKHMGPYIALEEQSMDEQLVSSLEDRTVDTRGSHPVFTTSTKLFVYIKGSITRCTALTKGNTFFLLYQAFQDSLRKYSQVLLSKLPPPLPQKSGVAMMPPVPFAKQQSSDATPAQLASYQVTAGEEVTVCHVIGTCEYCAETVEALEELIRETVDDEFKSKIDMMGQQEAFHEITAKAIRVLESGLENRLEDAFKMMASINWGVFVEVGEESDYVRAMHKEIQPYVSTARSLIPKSYFQSFCDKFALGMTTLYYESLIRLKTISEPGSQQLLLDVYNLKTLILKLPVLEKPSDSSHAARKGVATGTTIAPAMYTKMVQKQFKRIELLLKMTGTPVSLLVAVFKDQWPGGSALDLQQVMSLKGMKRGEQAAMLERFGLDAATARKGAASNITSATIVTERFQAVQDQASKVDMSQMRQKVSDFRNSFRQV